MKWAQLFILRGGNIGTYEITTVKSALATCSVWKINNFSKVNVYDSPGDKVVPVPQSDVVRNAPSTAITPEFTSLKISFGCKRHCTRNTGKIPSFLTVKAFEKNSLGFIVVGSSTVRCGKNEKKKVRMPRNVVGSPIRPKNLFVRSRHLVNRTDRSEFGGTVGGGSLRATGALEFGCCIFVASAINRRSRRRCLLLLTVFNQAINLSNVRTGAVTI